MKTNDQSELVLSDLETQFAPPERFGTRIAVLVVMFGLGITFMVIGFGTAEPISVVLITVRGGYVLMAFAVWTLVKLLRRRRLTRRPGSRPSSSR